ncbi:MAG: leucine--tRNA ligase, partial [Thermoprotei archaeon]
MEYLKSLVRKWRSVWENEKVYEADPIPGKDKYFLTAAFMYPNGPAHIGHARTYLIPDVLARFKRSLGINVLFPMAFHYTGTPILVIAERIASNDEDYIKSLSQNFNISIDELRKLKEPLTLARYFHELSKEAMKDYGLSIDWRREFTTIDPEFKSFIRWQFETLRSKGLLIKGTYPVGWCPYHNMPVGMHDTKDDVEPEIDEVTVIKFKIVGNEVYLPTATLRPETVLGVTNIWINPKAEYCLVEVTYDGDVKEKWILACEAAKRLSYQLRINIVSRV